MSVVRKGGVEERVDRYDGCSMLADYFPEDKPRFSIRTSSTFMEGRHSTS